MPNTYTKIHLHLVFSVQNRECIIGSSWRNELYKYITGIITNNKHKLLIINGMPDHVHILIGMRPTQSLSELMQDIKGDSSKWINERKLTRSIFSWQQGYGAFSCGVHELSSVIRYIQNQYEHHVRKTFIAEYLEMLDLHEIDYEERYVFKPVDY